jgi:hypothetical protein
LTRQLLRVAGGLTLILQVFVCRAECSQHFSPVWALGNERVRVVFPRQGAVDSTKAQLLIDTFEDLVPLPGLPRDILRGKRITFSLAAQPSQGVDGSADPFQQLIILPFSNAFEWEPAKLRRVIRHELAHVGMGIVFNYAMLAPWFQEGFAEWTAGGLTCEGETRIRVDMMMRRRLNRAPPNFLSVPTHGTPRLAYDYFGTIFDYIDKRWGGVVTDGTLLTGIKEHGLHGGLQRVLAVGLIELEERWQSHLAAEYNGLPEGLACNSSPS